MPRVATGVGAADAGSLLRHQANEIVLSRTRSGLWIFLVANFLLGTGEVLFAVRSGFALVVVRLVIAAATIALLSATRREGAAARAVPLALLGVALGCAQTVGPAVLRGDLALPAVSIVALGAGVSTVLPWGLGAQTAAIGITSLAMILMIALTSDPVGAAAIAGPASRTGVAFVASLYVAYLRRRHLLASVQTEIERAQAATALSASEEQLRHQLTQLDSLYRTAPMGLALVDTQLRYLRINQKLADANGLPPEAHIGRTVKEVLPEIGDLVELICRRVISTGEPVLDLEMTAPTQHEPGVVRDWHSDYWPIRNGDGTVVAVSCVIQDITERKRAQEALRQNEERLRIVSKATNDAVWDRNLLTDTLWWNDGVRTLFGYEPAQIEPTITWWSTRLHPEERERIVAHIHAHIDGGQENWSAEYRFRRADGTYACVFDRGYVFHDAGGRPVRMIGAMMDISERKRSEEELARLNSQLERRVQERTAQLEAANRRLEAEMAERQQAADALQESQQRLQDILDNATAVIYLKDTHGRYLLINTQFEILFHVGRAEVVGRTDHDIFPREAAENLRSNDRQVLAANRPCVFEEQVPHDDSVHTYISVKFPLRDPSGVPYGVCGISTDITARKKVEAELQASQAQLSAIFESSTDAIWSLDRDYRLTAFNSVLARMFHAAFGKPVRLGEPLKGRAPLREQKEWRALYDRAFRGERIVIEREYPLGGRTGVFLISMAPIVANDVVTGATVFCKDITSLKQAEQQARQHQAELTHVLRLSTAGEMAAGLAHEINQPLGAIANYAQGCRQRLASSQARIEDIAPALEEISTQALRAGEIIKRLRQLVQKREPQHEAVDLNSIVTDAARVIEPQARDQEVVLNLDLAPDLPPIEADTIQIEQVLLNLMLNGVEAMEAIAPEKAVLTVTSGLGDDGQVTLTVRDCGNGLENSTLDKIFEPFFTSKASGLGMGLAISRSIIQEHGGRLWASNNEDGGATFHIALPAAATGAAAERMKAEG